MQMPVTVVEMCLKGPGSQKLYVLESIPGVNVGKLVAIAEKCLSKSSPKAGISKEMLQDLCNLSAAESDRLLIKCACCKGQRYPRSNLLHCMVFMISTTKRKRSIMQLVN